MSENTFYTHPPRTHVSSASPSSGLQDLVMTDFDFEEVVNGSANATNLLSSGGGHAHSSHQLYQPSPFTPVDDNRNNGRGGEVDGEEGLEEEIKKKHYQRMY